MNIVQKTLIVNNLMSSSENSFLGTVYSLRILKCWWNYSIILLAHFSRYLLVLEQNVALCFMIYYNEKLMIHVHIRDSKVFYIYFLFHIEIRSHPVILTWLIKNYKENTPYKEIGLLVRVTNTRPILLSHNNPLLIHSVIWGIIQNIKLYVLKKSLRSWSLLQVRFSRTLLLAFPLILACVFLVPRILIKAVFFKHSKSSH